VGYKNNKHFTDIAFQTYLRRRLESFGELGSSHHTLVEIGSATLPY